MEGCQKLADILMKNPDISSRDFREDCAKILHCCRQNHQTDIPLYDDIKNLMDLEHAFNGKLRNRHLNLELALLDNMGSGVTRVILDNASQTVYAARTMLDQIMISFRQKHYSAIQSGMCTFFHVQQEHTNQPKTEQQVKDEMLKRFKTYKWDKFDTRFPHLFDFLVKVNALKLYLQHTNLIRNNKYVKYV